MIDAAYLRLSQRVDALERELDRRQVEVRRRIETRVYNSANQSIPNAAVTGLLFNTYRVQNGISVISSAFVAPDAGWYTGAVHVDFAANATGDRHLYVRYNGTFYAAIETKMAVTTGQPTMLNVPFGVGMAAGDTIDFQVYQASGGALNVLTATLYSPEAWMWKI